MIVNESTIIEHIYLFNRFMTKKVSTEKMQPKKRSLQTYYKKSNKILPRLNKKHSSYIHFLKV